MAGRPIAMHKFREIVLLFSRNVSIKETCRRLGISRNTVRRYRAQLEAHRGSIDDLLKMEEPELLVWFHPRQQPMTDAERYGELTKRAPELFEALKGKGVTKYLLWEEYLQECPDGYGYSQFCYHLAQLQRRSEVTMVQHFAPGEVVFFDFAGHTMHVTDPITGELHPRQIFLALSAHSHLTFAVAVPRQTVPCVVSALEEAFHFFGGTPLGVVCDNLKSAVIKSDRYEPTLNRVLADLATHYNVELMPARVYKPRDKARVELSVKHFYQRVMAPLRHRVFFSDAELNTAIAERMHAHSNAPMQRIGISRRKLYETVERQHMRPLPSEPFQLKWRKKLMAQKNNHIWLNADKTYYSVPCKHVGDRVDVIYTMTLVHIYAEGKLVATHRRTHTPRSYCTVAGHMPPPHQAMAAREAQAYLKWAESTGSQQIYAVVLRMLNSRRFIQQTYKSCDGIKSLCRRHGVAALEQTCMVALELDQCVYGFLKRHLEHSIKAQPQTAEQLRLMPQHDNIRGAGYYQ